MLRVPTPDPSLALVALTPADARAYRTLLQGNRDHLGPDFADELAMDEGTHAADFGDNTDPAHVFGLRLDGRLIGRIDLVPVDPPRYGMGYWLARDATGRGFATAAVRALTAYARDHLSATDVLAGVSHGNDRSVAVLHRAGFVEVEDFEHYTRFHFRLAAVAEPEGVI